MRKFKWLVMALLCVSLFLAGCGDLSKLLPIKDFLPEKETEATQIPETLPMEATVAQEETEPAYELKTVYLCTGDILTNYEDGSSFESAYTYDSFGRLYQAFRVLEDGTKKLTSTYYYDEFGNNIRQESQSSYYEMEYDDQGRLLSKRWYSGGECKGEYLYTYDEAGFVIQRVEISRYSEETVTLYNVQYDADHTESYVEKFVNEEFDGYTEETYDKNGQVLTAKNYDANGNWRSAFVYEYDGAGNLVVQHNYSRSETQADYSVYYLYEDGLLRSKNVDYYYGYLQEYFYETFEILVPADQ